MAKETRTVPLIVPATTANLGPGFDCLGMALQWYNSIEISETSENKAGLTIEGPEATEDIPRDRSNLTLRAVERVFSLAFLMI
jgi:homoserine kinase